MIDSTTSPSPQSAPRLTAWRILGPGGASAQFNPAASPIDKNLLLVSTDMTGCYISTDGGGSWRMFHLRWTCKFAFNPKDANTIYAAAGPMGLYKSQDKGRTWRLILPQTGPNDTLHYTDDEAESFLKAERRVHDAVTAVVVDPENPKVLYAAWGMLIMKSGDGGKSWALHAKTAPNMLRLIIDPRPGVKRRKIYAQFGTGLVEAEEGKFRELPLPYKPYWIYDATASFPPDGGAPSFHLVISTRPEQGSRVGVLLVSQDGGQTWKEGYESFAALAAPGAKPPSFRAAAASPTNPRRIYLSYGGLRRHEGRPPSFGVMRSDDAGQSWELVWEESDKPAPNIRDPWLSEIYGPDWGDHPMHLFVHPADQDFLLSTDYGRTMKSTDGGKTWEGLYSTRFGEQGWTTRGIDVLNCYGAHFDPFAPTRLLITCADIGVFRSENAGLTWKNSWTGVPRNWRNTMYWAEFDPEVKGVVWGASSRIHDIPRWRVFRGLDWDTWQGGVVKSSDGGRTWVKSSNGLPEGPVTHLLLDPRSPKESRTVYAASMMNGVFRSDDGGQNWTRKSAGIAGERPAVWRMAMDEKGALYVLLARRTPRAEPGSPVEGALYRSEDRGESWSAVPLPEGVNGPMGLAVEPAGSNRLLLAAWPRFDKTAPSGIARGGLYLSTDRGASWKPVLQNMQHAFDVTFDARRPGRAYACGFGGWVWRSDDAGETWRRLPGFNFKLGHRVILDPADPEMIYITTMGGSLWHGPAAGAGGPDDEDIAGPALVRYAPAQR